MNETWSAEAARLRRQEEEAFVGGDFARLAEVLRELAAVCPEAEEKAGTLCRAGVAALKAGNAQLARTFFQEVFGAPRWERLARLFRLEICFSAQDWPGCISVLEEELADAAVWEEPPLRLEKARLLAFRLGQKEEAEKELETILARQPDCREALWMKVVLALRSGNWEKAAHTYQRLADLAQAGADPALAQSLFYRLGQIHELRFHNSQAAEEWYGRLDPSRAPLLGRLARFELAESRREWEKAASQLTEILAAADQAGESTPPSLHLLLARLKEDALNDLPAADTLYEELSRRFPQDFSVLYAAAERAMETGRPERRVELDLQMMERLSDPLEKSWFAADRVRLLLEDLHLPEEAAASARKWLEAAPDDLSAGRWLIEALIRAGRYEEASQEIDRELSRTTDPREKQALLLRKTELAIWQTGDLAGAIAACREALTVHPSQFPVLFTLARLCHLQGDYNNLAKVLTAAVKLITDPVLQRFYRSWLAAICLERLGEDQQAFAIFGELLKKDPNDYTALKTIIRLSKRNQSWTNCAGALSRLRAAVSDPALQAELKCLLAWLYEIHLQRLDQAKVIYEELAASRHPFALEARRRLAAAEGDLAAYAETVKRLVEESPPGMLRSARLARLAGVYEIGGEFPEAWAAYEKARISLMAEPHLFLPMIDLAQLSGYWLRYLSLVEDFATRVSESTQKALLWEAAWARGETVSPEGKIDAAGMEKAFRALADQEESSQAALRGAWLATLWSGDPVGRSEVLVRLLKSLREEGAAAVRLKLAWLLRDELGAAEESIAAFRQVLAKEPKNLAVLRELALMYEQGGQWGELIRVLLQEIQLRREPPLLIKLYRRLGKLYEEKFNALDEAVKCAQAILRLEPGRLETHAELIRLLEARQRWEELAAALLACAKVSAGKEEKLSLLLRAASVFDERLHQPSRAVETLKEALVLEPAKSEVIAGLRHIYEREKLWTDLIRLLEDQISRTPAAAEQAALHEEIARIYEIELHEPGRAIEHLLAGRDLDPKRLSLLLSLERLFSAAERWEELIDTLERLAARAEPPGARDYFCRIGELLDTKLNQPDKAIISWERARELDLQHRPALEALVSLYERTRNFVLLVERSRALAELVADNKPRAVELLLRAATVLETTLQDDRGAIEILHRAMEIDSEALAPLAAAQAIHERRKEWPELIKLLFREESITPAPEKKLVLFTRIGSLEEKELGDRPAAAEAYRRALSLRGDYLPAVRPLAEIYFGEERWEEARPLYEIWSARSGEEAPVKAAEVWFRAGWCAEQAGEVPAAMSRYHSALGAAVYRPALERLSELYTKQEKWTEAGTYTSQLLAVMREADEREALFPLLLRQSRIEEMLGRLEEAAARLEEALEIRPGHYETLCLLVDFYRRMENWKKVLLTYDLVIRNAPTAELQAQGLVDKGEVLEDKIKEEQSALAHFQKAAQIMPSHLRVWQRLAGIYYRRQAWAEAEKALSQVIALESEAGRKVEAHYQLGRVYVDGFNDLARARAQFESALALDKLHIPSMEALGDIYLRQEEWQRFIENAEAFAKLVPAEKHASLLPLFLKMGAVYRDHIKNTERAIISFQQVLKHEPENEAARADLAALYVSDPKFIDQAKAENLNLIRRQPLRLQSYRDLANIYKAQGNLDAQFCLYSILKLFGALDYEEEIFYEANLPRVRRTSKRQLKDVDRQGYLLHPDERGVMHDALAALAPFLAKQFPAPLERLGARRSNLLPPTTASPVLEMVNELAENLGLPEKVLVYLSPQATEPQIMMQGDQHHLVLSSDWFNRFSHAEQRFLLGRLVEHMVNAHDFIMHHPLEQVVRTLSLILLAADPKVQISLPGLSEAEQEKQKKAARKLMPGKIRNYIEYLAERLTPDSLHLDLARWRKTMDHTANRAGLLVCGDITAAFSAIIKTDPRTRHLKYDEIEDPKTVWVNNEYVVELLAFAVSDAYFRLRDRAGFSLI